MIGTSVMKELKNLPLFRIWAYESGHPNPIIRTNSKSRNHKNVHQDRYLIFHGFLITYHLHMLLPSFPKVEVNQQIYTVYN